MIFGTYFLWILGPKSLASEGTALWIALTWPRGLESLLKAKAWLWTAISTAIVSLVLLYDLYLFPAEAWKIALAGVAWWFFGRSIRKWIKQFHYNRSKWFRRCCRWNCCYWWHRNSR